MLFASTPSKKEAFRAPLAGVVWELSLQYHPNPEGVSALSLPFRCVSVCIGGCIWGFKCVTFDVYVSMCEPVDSIPVSIYNGMVLVPEKLVSSYKVQLWDIDSKRCFST